MSGAARRVRAIAWQDLLDLGRQRGTWLSLMMFPLINVVLIVLVPGYLSEREQTRQATVRYTIGVEADAEDLDFLRSAVAEARFDLQPVDDAKRAVRERTVHVGMVLEPGADEAFASVDQARGRVIAVTTRRTSNLAFGRLIEVLEKLRGERALERAASTGLPPRSVRPLSVDIIDLADTDQGARLQLAQVLPFLVLLPLAGSVGIAAQRISGTKDARVIEPLLLLPIRRAEVLAGKALSGLALGTVILPAVVVPLLIGRYLPAGGAGRTVALPAPTIVAVAATSALLLVLLVAIGTAAGAAARTSTELSSALPFVTFPLILLALLLQFFGSVRATAITGAVPVLGPVLLVRDVGAGSASVGPATVVVVTTLVWSAVVVLAAGRWLARERTVLRVTG